jgi:phage terminase large subunit-like protein
VARLADSVRRERFLGGAAGLDASVPPWRAWKTRSRAARAIRWIETYVRIPSGARAGELLKLHGFQRLQLEQMLAPGVRIGGLQIPRGNAKSTLWAAVGLWALCDHDDAPQIPLVGFNSIAVQGTLWRPIQRMVMLNPELDDRVRVFKSAQDRRAHCRWNGGELLPLPADVDRLQGLNPTVALVDEAQTVRPEVWTALLQGAGKRPESLVLAIGTPSPGGQDSALANLRAQAGTGNVAWLEHAADPGCALDDRRQWRKANPGIAAGLLHVDQLERELSLVSEAEFRSYRLGQWVDAVVTDWLPVGAWEACPRVYAPLDGTTIIVGVAGTWQSTVAIVGATYEGGVFLIAAADRPSDGDIERTLAAAAVRWDVDRVIFQPHIRPNLVASLIRAGWGDIEVWPNSVEVDVQSSTEFRRAVVEGRLAHDHHPLLAEHVAATVARSTTTAGLRLGVGADGAPVDAALAARMAWWKANAVSTVARPGIW